MNPVDLIVFYSTGFIAGVFLISGFSKMTATERIFESMIGLQVPLPFRRKWIARIIPFVEVGLGIGLLVASGLVRSLIELLTLVLLLSFTWLLMRALSFEEEIDCSCFGALSSNQTVTKWSVARNALFILVTAVLFLPTANNGSWIVEVLRLSIIEYLLLLVGALAIVVTVLIGANYRLKNDLQNSSYFDHSHSKQQTVAPMSTLSIALGLDPSRPNELNIGSKIPYVELVGVNGITIPLSQIGNGKPVLLFFLSSDCSICDQVGKKIEYWEEELPFLQIRVVTSSTPYDFSKKFLGLEKITLFGSYSSRQALGVQASPAAIALGGIHEPVVASPVAHGILEIEGLIESLREANR